MTESVNEARAAAKTQEAIALAAKEQFLRSTADFENFRKRSVRRLPPPPPCPLASPSYTDSVQLLSWLAHAAEPLPLPTHSHLCVFVSQQAEKDALRDAVKGDVVGGFLPLVDNFELASKNLKLETEGEKRIDASYQVRCLDELAASAGGGERRGSSL